MRAKFRKTPLFDLEKSGLIRLVRATSANGAPLSAEERDGVYKPLMLDIGLMLNMLGLDLGIQSINEALFANEGALAEQFVAARSRKGGIKFTHWRDAQQGHYSCYSKILRIPSRQGSIDTSWTCRGRVSLDKITNSEFSRSLPRRCILPISTSSTNVADLISIAIVV